MTIFTHYFGCVWLKLEIYNMPSNLSHWGMISVMNPQAKMPHDFIDGTLVLVHVMAWCPEATNQYLDQIWPSYMKSNGSTRDQWYNTYTTFLECWRHIASYSTFSIHIHTNKHIRFTTNRVYANSEIELENTLTFQIKKWFPKRTTSFNIKTFIEFTLSYRPATIDCNNIIVYPRPEFKFT